MVKNSLKIVGAVIAISILGRFLLFVPVLFKFVFLPLVLSIPLVLAYYAHEIYKKAPEEYEGTGIDSRRYITDTSSGFCYCGKDADKLSVKASELKFNGRAMLEIGREETDKYCSEHAVTKSEQKSDKKRNVELEKRG